MPASAVADTGAMVYQHAFTASHTWEELAEYERAEALRCILQLISQTCLQHDHLRVLEREEWLCCGASPQTPATCTRCVLLFGHVRYCHREALLALIRRVRLHVIRDLVTTVTVGLQPGEAVPSDLLQPLVPSVHTDGYARWRRVAFAVRCGIFEKLHEREAKVKQRLHRLLQESGGLSSSSAAPTAASLSGGEAAPHSTTTPASTDRTSKPDRANTVRFYTEEFGELFTAEDANAALAGRGVAKGTPGSTPCKKRRPLLPMSAFTAAAKETGIELAQLAASVPATLVAWSYRYPESLDWLREHLFQETKAQRRAGTARRPYLAPATVPWEIDADPWFSFAAANAGVLPHRQRSQKQGWRSDQYQPHPKRAQIVLMNVDEDLVAARAAFDALQRRLGGWSSREVDLVSLWSGPEGLQSELATHFNIQTLPFVVHTRPAEDRRAAATAREPPAARARRLPPPPRTPATISYIACDPVALSKALHDVPDRPASPSMQNNTAVWHSLSVSARTQLAEQLTARITGRRLPLYFTATVTRDFTLHDAAATDAWRAIRATSASRVALSGVHITTGDLSPLAPQLRQLHALHDFEWNVQLIKPSAPFVSTLSTVTSQRRLEGRTRCVTCANCAVELDVDAEVHIRCLHCVPDSKESVWCETCAITLHCHAPHHILLRFPARTWAASLSLLWGPSSVQPLQQFLHRCVSNQSDYHYGVYCNRCRNMIHGVRWKCAVCYQVDLCAACARERRKTNSQTRHRNSASNSLSGLSAVPALSDNSLAPLHHDDTAHPMLYLPFAQGAEVDSFLRPECVASLGDWLETACVADEPS